MLERTLGPDEGCTILHPLTNPCCPITGYVVGLRGFAVEFAAAENTEAWDALIVHLLHLFQMCGCTNKVNFGIGTWLCDEGKSRHIHFDVVFCTPSRHSAAFMAYIYKQAAIYDVEKGEALYVVRPDDDENTHSVDA